MDSTSSIATVHVSSLIRWLREHLSNTAPLGRLLHVRPLVAISGGLVAWLLVVRALRWRRYNAIHREYGPKWNNGAGTITPEEAQKIIHVASMYDMPLLLNYALAFALFKTYGIPSISKLLCATKELKSKETVSRRYADTELLICHWFASPISGFHDPPFAQTNKGPDARPAEDPRANIALARVNWLHSKYKIPNDDYLYTLGLFMLEPAVWADRYGWRKLSPLERHAFYIFWVEIGRRMGITDIPDTLEGMILWCKEFEETHMVPAETNKEVAGHTLEELLSAAPEALGLKSFGERIVISLLDEIVRKAMMFPEQSRILRTAMVSLLRASAFVQHFFLLPHISPRFPIDLSNKPRTEAYPRMHPTKWAAKPWYRPEPTSLLGRARERFLVAIGWYSELPGAHLRSSGYRIEEMGPVKFENLGHEEIMQRAAEMQGCPIVGPWSLEGRTQQA